MNTSSGRHYQGPIAAEKTAEAILPGAQLAASFPFVQALHGQRVLVLHTATTLFEPAARQTLARDMAMLGATSIADLSPRWLVRITDR